MRYGGWIEPGLYLGILLFNLILTFAIGEPLLGTIGILLYLPVVALFVAHPLNRQRHATPLDLSAHLRDYPSSPLATLRDATARPVRVAV